MNPDQIITCFKTTLKEFLVDIKPFFPDYLNSFIGFSILLETNFDIKSTMELFHRHNDMILSNQDTNSFPNPALFEALLHEVGTKYSIKIDFDNFINVIRTVWETKLTAEDKQTIWLYFKTFKSLCDKFYKK